MCYVAIISVVFTPVLLVKTEVSLANGSTHHTHPLVCHLLPVIKAVQSQVLDH